MSKNGFFHEYPYAQDIVVSPEMETALNGCQHINATVSNSRYDDNQRIIADCVYNGVTYTVRSEHSIGGYTYWFLIK